LRRAAGATDVSGWTSDGEPRVSGQHVGSRRSGPRGEAVEAAAQQHCAHRSIILARQRSLTLTQLQGLCPENGRSIGANPALWDDGAKLR
jgi:hypothetical protein